MKKLISLTFLLFLLCNISYGQTEIKIAILDFPTEKGALNKEEAAEFTNEFVKKFEKSEKIKAIAGEELHSTIKKLKLPKTKFTAKQLKRLSDSLGIDYVLETEIRQIVEDKYIRRESSQKEGDTTYYYQDVIQKIKGEDKKVIFTGSYLINMYIIDVKDGSVKYVVKEKIGTSGTINNLSEKVSVKIEMKPIEVHKIANSLYVYPENIGPLEIVDAYAVCGELNARKMYGFSDWRPPTLDEIQIMSYSEGLRWSLEDDTYILSMTHQVFNPIKYKETVVKDRKGFNYESYEMERVNPNIRIDLEILRGLHYFRPVRGGFPAN